MDSRGYYALLGVSQDANFQEIKKSYRRLARKYHPDRNKSPLAEETIKKLTKPSKFFLIGKKKKYDSDSYDNFDSNEPSNETNNEICQVKTD